MTKADNKIDSRAEKKEQELKARLAYNGFNQRDVAKKLGTHFTLINKVIRGHRKTKRVLAFIEQLPLGERVS
jgi:transcriptional regulator with XRE-family HTH domain